MGKGNRTRDTKKTGKNIKDTKKSVWPKVLGWGLGSLFLLVLIFGILHTTGVLQRATTAVTVGEEKINALEFNIYYTDSMNRFISQNSETLAMFGINFSAGFEAQPSLFSDDGSTWGDYFRGLATSTIAETLVLYQEGKKAGHVISAEYQELLDIYMDSFEEAGAYYGTTAAGFISQTYGNGTKLADIKRVAELNYYATSYSQAVGDSYSYTASDVEDYYLENKEKYDVADYASRSFTYTEYTYKAPAEGETLAEGEPTSEDDAKEMTEKSRLEAKEKADAFLARIKAGEDFDTVAKEYHDAEMAEKEQDTEFSSRVTTAGGLTGTGGAVTWVKDESRKSGDMEVVDDEATKSYVVISFDKRYRKELASANIRHILFSAVAAKEDATDKEKGDAELAAKEASENALKVLSEWEKGDRTEESFAALAKEHSADGNALQGGIYEHVAKGSMVEPFDEWLFDPDRKVGDTGIVQTEYGYHIMYFVGSDDQPAYYYAIEDLLAQDEYTEYYNSVAETYTVETKKLGLIIAF